MRFKEEYLVYEQLKADVKVLEKKLADKQNEVLGQEGRLSNYRNSMEQEKKDYDDLERTSLAQIVAKIAGNYDEKKEKEYREYIEAKQRFEDAKFQVDYVKQEAVRLEEELQITKIKASDKLKYIKETFKESEDLKQLDAEKEKLLVMKKEYEEALWAVRATKGNAENAFKFLENANDAATWDAFGGDFISSMMKYSSLDNVERSISAMNAAASQMKKELADINITFATELDYIDNTTRMFDIWFDNIFTDLEVRDRIKANMIKIEGYIGKLQTLEYQLRDQYQKLEKEIAEFEI